ncbi:DNA gyrase subunit A [Candidatus Palibaumannia cicadellinicola]|uniref:DNA gyrase subunit A n=1 Tax=Candidatus Palibaumannia cicadellinicola TaxID=186490 RepID=A0A0K2BKS0_9GAMM|nr:DNA topoisomerase (ATP-hydrolyzing) subunit A [Candidatus Baumannia cicadellinicola]AKZ65930.1 DNA gyrase subunit A [Candidatus Baumannia cicadellinicola]
MINIATAKEIIPISIEEELKRSYLDYAMSVIIGRALPDVRDGLKPVHRRVLFAMRELGNDWNKPYKKSARVVGDVIGKYHPHGDTAVYDAIVRMAQPFSLRYMLVDGQGNFGSIDGDSAAAMRYTEVRMSQIAHELLVDLDKETVDHIANYDGTESIPEVLPTRIPNILVNGSSGIAVGMATNIPPHNMAEVIDGCLAYINNENISIQELMKHIQGPDFPTAAIINGRVGIEDAYRTGRGKICIRARATVETDLKTGREIIVVREIPYQVNKARLIEKIAELVKDKRIAGISFLRDESDKDGMRIVIGIKRDAVADIVLNKLYLISQLQVSFGINMVALHKGQPKILSLKEILSAFVSHRKEVVTRRTIFELRKASERIHILEALAIAQANIESIIKLTKQANTPVEAKTKLVGSAWELGIFLSMLNNGTSNNNDDPVRTEASEYGIHNGSYYLTEKQAQSILDLRLHKLTCLEQHKLMIEYQEILTKMVDMRCILNDPKRLREILIEELNMLKIEYNDSRRTEITTIHSDLFMEDIINKEDVVVTLSYQGYVKYQPLKDYEAQRRGGKGKSAARMKEEDFIHSLLVANTHDTILLFSSLGRMYWMKVYQLPTASRGSRGRPIVNLLPLEQNERITTILPVRKYEEGLNIFMATASGTVKKTALTEFSRPRSTGIIAVNLHGGDELIGVNLTNGSNEVMLFSAYGKVVRFSESQVRSMGRTATGVRGINLAEGDKVVSLIVPRADGHILTVTRHGYGKRTAQVEYPTKSRYTQGVISIKVSERNGEVVGAVQVNDNDQIMLITDAGTLVRTRVSEVSIFGRNTQGITIIRTAEAEHVVSLQRVAEQIYDDIRSLINNK